MISHKDHIPLRVESPRELPFPCLPFTLLLINPPYRPQGVVASKDGARIQSQLWKELATILMKEAPETEGVWNF